MTCDLVGTARRHESDGLLSVVKAMLATMTSFDDQKSWDQECIATHRSPGIPTQSPHSSQSTSSAGATS